MKLWYCRCGGFTWSIPYFTFQLFLVLVHETWQYVTCLSVSITVDYHELLNKHCSRCVAGVRQCFCFWCFQPFDVRVEWLWQLLHLPLHQNNGIVNWIDCFVLVCGISENFTSNAYFYVLKINVGMHNMPSRQWKNEPIGLLNIPGLWQMRPSLDCSTKIQETQICLISSCYFCRSNCLQAFNPSRVWCKY